ncbi:MAG: 16S rRNA (adenine(1518)-N(6)/adenine(1519)-N(6))-dimethyltransferase RsmA [Candidatus Omnitrophica bacterium]|nr:16S rRNA (adenine(1518)-N(6)/adenine(1519)-N(6))-dimethyltransferase RsmA [Candidatus Omnitrophota bacterium]MDD5488403.1 16S rRNA (adenine(1518)-N(6)/adenine(1519)-N(6))-dimethyltransferase RsmA [Candidatus Omnitrophota bacterium]
MNLKELKKLWEEAGFGPLKSLGQNFLVDNNVKEKIISLLPYSGEDTVVEIGPGFGSMTFSLARSCRRLVAVEKDARICGLMAPMFREVGNIDLVSRDILKTDIAEIASGGKVHVYGNIPYYISSPIIEHLISNRDHIKRIYLMVQEEFADRIVAPPGSRTYGSLSCFVQFYTKPAKVMRISRNCFSPRPKVDSALLEMDIPASPRVGTKDETTMFCLIRKAFSQRRKKMINPLSGWKEAGLSRVEWENIFHECGIDPGNRAEHLSLEEFARISDKLVDIRGSMGREQVN